MSVDHPTEDEIDWCPPPDRSGGHPTLWPSRLDAIARRPGFWGRVPGVYYRSVTSELRRCQRRGYVDPQFRFRASSRDTGDPKRVHLWACYGEPRPT